MSWLSTLIFLITQEKEKEINIISLLFNSLEAPLMMPYLNPNYLKTFACTFYSERSTCLGQG
jgi:hypothetical protein